MQGVTDDTAHVIAIGDTAIIFPFRPPLEQTGANTNIARLKKAQPAQP